MKHLTLAVVEQAAADPVSLAKLRGKTCQCRACGRIFTTANTFDKHRIGDYAIGAPGHGRRCRTDAELETAGFGLNARGRWFRPRTGPARAYVRAKSTQNENSYPAGFRVIGPT